MNRFFNPCRSYRQNVCLLAGGALAEPQRNQIENHLAACADCRNYYEEIKAVTVPLTNWAENFSHLQPTQTVKMRWASAVLSANRPTVVPRATLDGTFRGWWQEVIWPSRRVWAGFAAVWLMILAGNFSLRDHSQTSDAKFSPQTMLMAFKDQQRILAELLPDHSLPRDADRQRIFSPKPRTESPAVLAA